MKAVLRSKLFKEVAYAGGSFPDWLARLPFWILEIAYVSSRALSIMPPSLSRVLWLLEPRVSVIHYGAKVPAHSATPTLEKLWKENLKLLWIIFLDFENGFSCGESPETS